MVIILMLISAMMTSVAITREKELGTMEVLLVSPVRPLMVVLGKVVPYFLLGMLIAGIAVWMGNLVFGLPVRGSYGLLLGEMVLFVMTSLALGILISTRTDSQMVAMMLSLMALMMPTILLSGFIFPIESMPRPLQLISHILPGKWFLIILKNVMLKGVGFGYVWKETAILSGMLLLLLAAGIRNFKIRLA
jgi:ABC-2 type transport system permease protein